ncbi:MAG: hypothetical protein ACRC5M_04625 [Anaeroplasmataceae bacterium]
MAKNTLSSVLYQDFGVEDFESGRPMRSNESLAGASVANQLGLLGAIGDKSNTDPISFALESASLLGESIGLSKFASGQISEINQRFTIAAQIKRQYGVEGFDAFAYGCEGFMDKVKGAFSAIVAGIKKLIQSISNWIRGVMNWVGSQFAKLQQRLIDKYQNEKFTDTSVVIKAVVPATKVESGASFVKKVDAIAHEIAKAINAKNIEMIKSNGGTSMDSSAKSKLDSVSGIGESVDSVSGNSLADKVTFVSLTGKRFGVTKLGSATRVANLIVFGTDKLSKITVSAVAFLEKKTNWTTILSRDDLKVTNNLVKDGKAMIKVMNDTLKMADRLAREMKHGGFKKNHDENQKADNIAAKETRKRISVLNNQNRIGSLMTGILYGVFSNYLKMRSYTASAVKALVKENGSKSKPAKEGSSKQRRQEAKKKLGEEF